MYERGHVAARALEARMRRLADRDRLPREQPVPERRLPGVVDLVPLVGEGVDLSLYATEDDHNDPPMNQAVRA